MQKLLILHLGMSKTGSTSLQRAMLSKRDALRTSGVLFPEAGTKDRDPATHNEFFFSIPGQYPTDYSHLPKPLFDFDTYADRLGKEFDRSGCQVMILSSENVWNPATYPIDHFMKIRDHFRSFEMVILVYLREAQTHVKAAFGQQSRAPMAGPRRGWTGTFEQFLDRALSSGVYDYERRIQELERVFGPDSVYPCAYEDARRAGLNKPLEALIALKTGRAVDIPLPQSRADVSPNWLYVRVSLIENRIYQVLPAAVVPLKYVRLALNRPFLRDRFKNDRYAPISTRTARRLAALSQDQASSIRTSLDLSWWTRPTNPECDLARPHRVGASQPEKF